ncbi:3-phosphoshikimate 1-carboxyvinyltransferase [Aquisalibacillus elongatus]|uniref:3-phosphoshikimate 1-carboxyvinyltransferase n=1 Tax=Aquisalibacillus elongatus TaxID=485577 RepID=A0A3N5C8C3_9BACI|nr:3-phosphoshikimate 1-carboxyvinyltransferase [Aquisalibacillus elongatus]RPF55772.1 3-phosphoshikimate 1-carboxyvinyltransferase [Aquisalibacillus elongatus]
MKTITANQKGLKGDIRVPGDKSISHRSIMLASLANGQTRINNFLNSEDSMRTVEAFKALGVKIEMDHTSVLVQSAGWQRFKAPQNHLYMGNSGTTLRLISGILSGLPFETKLTGDESLSKRPMKRVIRPLKEMGSTIESNDDMLPITIRGGGLTPIEYHLPVDSAQVKSAILLAGLMTTGKTTVIERHPTRDHTERMLPLFNGNIDKDSNHISIDGPQKLVGTTINIPGDISSASFWITGAVITPNSHIVLRNVGLNPTRTGLISVLKRMGANIRTEITRYEGEEPVGDIYVQYSKLYRTELYQEEVASLIDEVPLLALIATQSEGNMYINHIEELKYKESNRVKAIVDMLKALNANVEEVEDGIFIEGKSRLQGNYINTYHDHRVAMVASIASLITDGAVTLSDGDCVNISYPSFYKELYRYSN